MYDTSEFKKGLFVEMDGVPFQIEEFQHVKPGKGNAIVRTKLRNLINNNLLEKTFRSGEKLGEPNLERRTMQYLYHDGDGFQFMDLNAYEQITLNDSYVADNKYYLIESMEIEVLYYQGKPIALQLPTFVNLKVTYTEPALKGDTVSGGSKPATLSTGLSVAVPFHIKQDDMLKIDTRTGEYVEKVK